MSNASQCTEIQVVSPQQRMTMTTLNMFSGITAAADAQTDMMVSMYTRQETDKGASEYLAAVKTVMENMPIEMRVTLEQKIEQARKEAAIVTELRELRVSTVRFKQELLSFRNSVRNITDMEVPIADIMSTIIGAGINVNEPIVMVRKSEVCD